MSKRLPLFQFNIDLAAQRGREHCPRMRSTRDVAKAFAAIAELPSEVLIAGCLDCKGRLLRYSAISIGSSDLIVVRVSDAFRDAIASGAASLVLVHNHPSGSIDPSKNDIDLTRHVAEAGAMLGISLVDHVLIANSGFRSIMTKEFLQEVASVVKARVCIAAEASVGTAWDCDECDRLNLLYYTPVGTCTGALCQCCAKFKWVDASMDGGRRRAVRKKAGRR